MDKVNDTSDKPLKRQLIIVTGLSGAGKSAALHAFEDIGYQTIDNLPLTMLGTLLNESGEKEINAPLVIGMDSRTLFFSPELFVETIQALRRRSDLQMHVLFMDASDDVLMKRFSETRRPHPLGATQLLRASIRKERDIMALIRQHIDGILDTTSRTPSETRRIIRRRFISHAAPRLIVTCMSFGFAHGVPRDADMVFDVRFLRNPHYVDDLRPMTGREEKVANYVRADEGYNEFIDKIEDMVAFLLPRYRDEGKSYLTIAFGCTGGRHRSVAVAEVISGRIAMDDTIINLYHRDISGDETR